jgi:peptidyl-prolyl cis-trans isomerase SurA
MINYIKYPLVALFILIITIPVFAQRESVDRIIAIVGEEVILSTELANQIQITVLQTQSQPKTQQEMIELQNIVLDQMISDRLFLIAARKDTLISIREEEIEANLDEQVARISQNFDTYDEFLQAIADEGLTLRELRKKYRSEVENQLLKQRFIQQTLYSISVSKHEVEEFYKNFSDSIPTQPEAVKLAHILLNYKASNHVVDSVKSLAKELRQKIIDGADFAEISTQYSSSGAGANGGELGYLSRDDVVPEFSRAAFNLQVGDISGIVETQFGIHIIKCEDKRDDRLKLRHVLLATPPSKDDSLQTNQLADSLRQAAWDGEDFNQMAKTYSNDDNTRVNGGELGWFAVDKMPEEFIDAVSGWKEAGEVRGPIITQFGLHLLKLLEYQAEKKYTLENDYDRIKELARQKKTGKFMNKWIIEQKANTYTKIIR